MLKDHEGCAMQDTEVVLSVLRERGRKDLPCTQLYRQMFNRNLYLTAYGNIYSNKGAMTPCACGETADGMSEEKISQIIELMRFERYRFSPVRRTYIPKKNGKLRPLGLPSWSDKLVGEVVRLLLEAIYEPAFSGLSHGFRKGRGCHTALRDIRDTWTGTVWFIEADISDCLDPWSYCSFADCAGLEQPVLGGGHLDTQAFPAPGAGEDGAELAALDLLQYGLAGDAERAAGVVQGEPAVGGVVGEHAAQLAGEAHAPGRAGGDLLAGDEAVVEPAQQGGWRDLELVGRFGHVEQFSLGGCIAARLVAGDVPVGAQ